jgi:hypothetical protein
MGKKMSNRHSFFELIEEAHDHGRDCYLLWERDKSFQEFLMQYNLVSDFNMWKQRKNKDSHPKIAVSLKKKGHTIREIAKILGYKHPGSISHLLNKTTKQ